eukprot:4038755-Prymnesium_polylepis.1
MNLGSFPAACFVHTSSSGRTIYFNRNMGNSDHAMARRVCSFDPACPPAPPPQMSPSPHNPP